MLKRSLTLYDYADLSRRLKCESEALIAIAKVESKGDGFDESGFPIILFERHKFYKNADRSMRDPWALEFPTICHRKPTPKGGYGKMSDQRPKFSKAFALDPDAAMMACSWGAFQELGENFDDYSFESVGEFVDMMKSGIDGQLEIFVRSIRKRGLVDELQRKDFAGFARNYNGPGYKKFNYDTKMGSQYFHWKAKKIDWKAVLAEGDGLKLAAPIDVPPEPDDIFLPDDGDEFLPTLTEPDPAGSNVAHHSEPTLPVELPPADAGVSQDAPAQLTAEVEQTNVPKGDEPSEPATAELVVEDWKPWVFRWLKRIWGSFAGIQVPSFSGFSLAAVGDVSNWYVYVIAAVVIFLGLLVLLGVPSAVLLAMWYFNRKEIERAKLEEARSLVDPDRRNLKVRVEKK